MVLHISTSSEAGLVSHLDSSKLTEDLLHGLAHDVGQHIQPTYAASVTRVSGSKPLIDNAEEYAL